MSESEKLICESDVIKLTWQQPSYYDPINILTELREKVQALPSAQLEIIRCKDCRFGKRYFDVRNGQLRDEWVECLNPNGLHRDCSNDSFCSTGLKRE